MSRKSIDKLLTTGSPAKQLEQEYRQHGTSALLDNVVIEEQVASSSLSYVQFIREQDELYKRGCSVDSVANAVRVEQGEFAVLQKSVPASSIGTHHVTPCVVICVASKHYYGMAHFDSHRVPGSLAEFFKRFKQDEAVKIQILGGSPGSDYLRSGTENKETVLAYIQHNLPNAEIRITEPDSSAINLVFDGETVEQKQFAVGLGVDKEQGALMRLRHCIGGIVTSQQSRSEQFIAVNFLEAYQGDEQPIFLDRLALKAVNEFDSKPIKGEEMGWTVDPGGFVLTQEMNFAHQIISQEVKEQQSYMESMLLEVVADEGLRKKLVDLCPIYIGPYAKNENAKTIQIIEHLCSEEKNPELCISKALLLFNKASPYPLMTELVSSIEEAYRLDAGSLAGALNEKFGSIDNLAYGVDVVAPDIVYIINDLCQRANKGLVLVQQLQDHTVDIRTLLKNLAEFYGGDEHDLLTEMSDEYNRAIATDENIDKIISAMDNKSPLAKGNILQILGNHYPPGKMRGMLRIFESVWRDAAHPKAALEDIIRKIPPSEPFDWRREYNELSKAFNAVHLQARDAQELIALQLDESQPDVKGVINKILKDAIVTVMLRRTAFEVDYMQKQIVSSELARVIREFIPYKKDTTAELEVAVNAGLTMS